ncbi:tryptophan--tRNA ligase [Candidatus Woesearchaeota archaeon]|nr:tryptophan--tRNA ligase [Candidatus Woesearchaeota archaeon]
MARYVVTPWEVEGDVDYKRLMTEFGIQELDDRLLERIRRQAGGLHPFLSRRIFFAHRDFGRVLDQYDQRDPFFLYTGRAPSGHTHLGHLVPWIFTKWLQDAYGVELWFQFPDDEKFLFKERLTLEDTNRFTEENMLDVIALGFDPKRTHFLIDTRHAGIMYREALRVAKRITFSQVKSSFGLTNEANLGQVFYTAMQAVPAFLPSVLAGKSLPCLIPHAVDQDPHFRLSRDVVGKLGYDKPASIQCRFLPPLEGTSGKMSASADSLATIWTVDDERTVRKKVNKYAFSGGRDTVEDHRRLGGRPEVDVAYQYLTFFEEDDTKLRKIHDDYAAGKILSGELKGILVEKLVGMLGRHQDAREKARNKVDSYLYTP